MMMTEGDARDDSAPLLSPTSARKAVRFGQGVVQALSEFRQGHAAEYTLLLRQLADPDIKEVQLECWLKELRGCVAMLSKDYELLVSLILRISWMSRGRAVVEEYLSFLTHLVSAQTIYLRSCLIMLLSNFTRRKRVVDEAGGEFTDSDDDDEDADRCFQICHKALELIAGIVPSTPMFLMPLLAERFPFVTKSPRTQECYVHNLLRVTTYLPVLRRDVLALLLDRLLKLDVNAPRQDIEDAEQQAAVQSGAAQEEVFHMDEDAGVEARGGRGGGGEKSEDEEEGEMAHTAANTLDVLMALLFRYIHDTCHSNGKLDVEMTKAVYRDLLDAFDRLLLPTHASCHVQFCLFYLCSFRLGLAEAFLEHLWKKLQNPSEAAIIRQAAVGYMGSLLARAQYIPVGTVRACLGLLVPWLHRYIDGQEGGARPRCLVAAHGPFYAACQAVFYSFSFRHRQLLEPDMRKGLAYLQSLNLERIVLCRLNPLRVCRPPIVNIFAALTRRYQIAFCYSIMEKNSRQRLPVAGDTLVGAAPASHDQLDAVFPFDPYLLRRSRRVIAPLFREWRNEDLGGDLALKGRPSKMVVGQQQEDEDDFLKSDAAMRSGSSMTPGSYDPFNSGGASFDSPPYKTDMGPTPHAL
ncbi:RNA polymerase I-specific transcription initiation factor RRN3 [Lampetra fluviatilis]